MTHAARLSLLLALLVPALSHVAHAIESPSGLSLLDVGSAQERPAGDPAPAPAPSVAAAPATTPAALPGTGKVALLVRGAKFGIHPFVQGYVARLARAFAGDRDMQAFLRENLERTYLSDERDARGYLERLGYEVKLVSSADGRPDMKQDLLDELAKDATALMVFYGHGSPSSLLLAGEREHQAPGPDEIRQILQGRDSGSVGLDADEMKAALARRPGGSKLDALIMHCCRGATQVYAQGGRGDWSDCVKPDGAGFFAGWVTYSVYFAPKTPEVLDACFAHLARAAAGAPGLAASARYYKKTGPMARKMAQLAGLDDEVSIQDEYGVTYATFERDAAVREHSEAQIAALDGLSALIDLAHALRYGRSSLGEDVKRFASAYQAYARARGIDTSRDGRPAPRVSDPPTRDEVNALIDHHGADAVATALDSLMPGLVVLRRGRAWLDESDRLQLDVAADVGRAQDLEGLIDIVSGAFLGQARAALAGSTAGNVAVVGGDRHAFALSVGPQLAARVRATVDTLKSRLPDQLLALRLRMSLEKSVPAQAWTGTGAARTRSANRLLPLVHGYNLAVGNVPAARRASSSSPYEIHVALRAVNDVVRPAVDALFGDEIELEYAYTRRFLPTIRLYAYAKLHDFGPVSGAGQTLSVPIDLQVRVNWGIFGNGYAYATWNARCAVSTPGGLRVGLAPSGWLTLGSGWPGPAWLQAAIAALLSSRMNAEIARATPAEIDIAGYIPADVRDQVAGRVRISRVQIADDVLSVYLDHE